MQQLSDVLADRYTLVRELGRGGMATVYLARDLKHDRNVALKVLDPELGAVLGAERFLAEIKVTANLQHPNLLPLFDSGAAGGLLFYTMPFVDGESLRARLEREKQLSIDEALHITTAVAGALDYAHRHGVIHRDLKPENILLADGQPLLADFGIALAVSNAGGSRITQTGLSLGTPQYMSPEQATGDRAIDGRTDIYSLGAILFEMLTGDPPYVGSTAQAVIARVLTEPPRSVRASRNTVSESIDHAVNRALAKLPADRFATAHEFAIALRADAPAHPGTTQPRVLGAGQRPWTPAVPWIVAAAAVALALATLAKAPSVDRSVVRSTLLPPPNLEFSEEESMGAMSPDGTRLAFVTLGLHGETQLWVRRLDTLSGRAIPGTDGALAPFWSPDGKSIGYFAQSSFNVADGYGGGVTKQGCSLPTPYSGAWGSDGTIAIASDSGIIRASATGNACSVAVKIGAGSFPPRHVWLMPDNQHVLFTSFSATPAIVVGDLRTGSSNILAEQVLDPTYVAPGILLFGRLFAEGQARVWARRFDANRLKFSGDAVPVTGGVRTAGAVFAYAASDGPALAYLPGRGDNGEIITDRGGRIVDTARIDGAWTHRWARAHPWIAAITATNTLVKFDLERHTQTVVSRTNGESPVWSPADSAIAQGKCDGASGAVCGLVVTRMADGHDSLLVKITAQESIWPSSWSNDGRYLVYTLTSGFALLGGQTWVYDFATRAATRALGMPNGTLDGAISPDNGWLRTVRMRRVPGKCTCVHFSVRASRFAFRWLAVAHRCGTRTAESSFMRHPMAT